MSRRAVGSDVPTVVLSGHQEKSGILELLRLFYGSSADTENGLPGGQDSIPFICSSISPSADGGTQIETSCGADVRKRLLPHGLDGVRPHPLVRREIKRQLYDLLSSLTGRKFPYGSLTGIRPTRLAAEALRRALQPPDVRLYLEQEYGVSPEKSALLTETAAHEQRILTEIDPQAALIYLNVPFCPTRCSYCSFTCAVSGRRPLDLDGYVEAMIREARSLASHLKQPIDALYMGGGTPTTLSAGQLECLLTGVLPALPIRPATELTVEAGRPDTIDPEKLRVIRKAGVSRICVNPQTLHDRTLVRIGRQHTVEDTRRAFEQARDAGFAVINSDLIAGLPGESPTDFLQSVQTLIAWGPENITIHTLAFKRKSELTRSIGPDNQPDDADAWSWALDQAHEALAQAGYAPYYLYRQKDMVGGLENTGYARPGTECRYNVGMMSDERMVVCIGAGAMSKYLDAAGWLRRYPSPRDLQTYLQTSSASIDDKIRTLFGPV